MASPGQCVFQAPRLPYPPAPLHIAQSGGLVPVLRGHQGLYSRPLDTCFAPPKRSCSAKFQPRGEGRGPDAEACLRLAKGRVSWRRAGRTPPPKAGPENSQLERVEPGRRSWKGAGPDAPGLPRRAGGALGCHKVNGRRRGVAVRREAHPLSLRVRERRSRAAARAQGGGPHPGRVPGPWPLPALQTAAAAAAAGSLPVAGLTVSARPCGDRGSWGRGATTELRDPQNRTWVAELGNGAWGTGLDWEGVLQNRGRDLGKRKLSVGTRGTDKRETQGIQKGSRRHEARTGAPRSKE